MELSSRLTNLDLGVVAAYFAVIALVVGVVLFNKSRKAGNRSSVDYFLCGKNLSWFVIGASLFASNIGSEHIIGLGGAGAAGDFPAAQFELLAGFMLLILGWVFVPFYLKSGVNTMPEFLEKRFGIWSRKYLAWTSITSYVLTKISITVAAGSIVFTTMLGIDFWTGALVIVAITGLYTVIGGMNAVVYTDLIQLFVLIGGSIAITWYGLAEAGGWDRVAQSVPANYTSLWRPFNDPDFPWTGILFGAPILGVWYWCTDQFIVQRVLAAKNLDEARKGSTFGGLLKVLPLFIFVIPGVIALHLSQGPNAVLTFPIENGEPVYDAAIPLLTMTVLPPGVRGLVIAGLLAAIMSSLSSVFSSCATIFTYDIYKHYKPKTSDRNMIIVGQVATVILVGLSLLWIPMLQVLDGGLFQKLQSIQAYIAPPIAAVFILGVSLKHIPAKSANYTLLIGAVIGILRLVLELNKSSLSGGLHWFATMNFLHFALFLFTISVTLLLTLSNTTWNQLSSISWNANTTITTSKSSKSTTWNVLLSLFLVGIILYIWYAFS